MVNWGNLLQGSAAERQNLLEEAETLLPNHRRDEIPTSVHPKDVTKIALRLKHQIEQVVPIELDEARITQAHSGVITSAVIETAANAGGKENRAAVVFCLLIVKKWFKRLALLELWDADLHDVRAVACEVIAKKLIEEEEDTRFLLEEILLKKYSILERDGKPSQPSNVVEKAVDLHALRVIGSSGYQQCISYLWKGWYIQDENDPSRFINYEDKANPSYWVHVDPDRMRVPLYQNALQVLFSLVFLGLYTGAINTINPTGDLDIVEGLLYIFTAGFIFDEVAKFWKVGRYYLSFWNGFNSILYSLLLVSFILRMIALGHELGSEKREFYNELSYDFLAFSAPMFWARLLLYFDSLRFFGTMLVVLKVMMRESVIFFALLFLVLVGFFQAFIGLDQVDEQVTTINFVTKSMINAIMTSPDFDGFDNYSPPFGLILYYIYTFIVMTILLNILVALYNASYSAITDNATDEYMALFASKTLQFVRAPDENVFIAPLNLIELFLLVLPLEWWMPKKKYEKLNDWVMATLYSPLLLVTAAYEVRNAKVMRKNARKGRGDNFPDEDSEEHEWERLARECGMEDLGSSDATITDNGDSDGNWEKEVEKSLPNISADPYKEIKKVQKELDELKELLMRVLKEREVSDATPTDGADVNGDKDKKRLPTPDEG